VFVLRVLPLTIALVLALGILLPAYILYEPAESGEVVGWTLLVPAILGAAGIVVALSRAAIRWRATRVILRQWLSRSVPISPPIAGLEAYRLSYDLPIVAIVGCFRPKLFVADCVFESLGTSETAAAIAHERAHLVAHDNFKNAVARLGSDTLAPLLVSGTLQTEWMQASEEAADDLACNRDKNIALDLASALIKVARIAPAGVRLPFSGGMAFSEPATVAHRVERLARSEWNARGNPGRAKILATRNVVLAALTVVAAVFALQLAMTSSGLARVHLFIEMVVSKLQ